MRQKGGKWLVRKHTVKEYYTEALLQLLKHKRMENITVSDLVRKSGCSRASFYRNYLSKDQILDEYLEKLLGEIFLRHPLSAENMREEVRCIFADIFEEKEALATLARAGQLSRIDQILYRETLSQIGQLGVLKNKYQPYFFAGAAGALIKAWIQFDFAENTDQITDIFFRSLAGYMSFS